MRELRDAVASDRPARFAGFAKGRFAMAHGITSTDGLMLAGTPAWHGLGTVLPERCSAFEALDVAKMNWTVQVCPFTCDMNGQEVFGGDFRAVIREDTKEVFATCSSDYRAIQNADIADMAYEISNQSGRAVESAGSIRGGRKVWFLLDMGTIYAAQDDKVKPYLFFGASHDLSMSLTVGTIATRVVCANTFKIALSEMGDNALKIRHTLSASDRVQRIKDMLTQPQQSVKAFADDVVRMVDAPITDDQIQSFFTSVWQKAYGKLTEADIKGDTRRATVFQKEVGTWLRNFKIDHRQTSVSTSGSVWSAFNAITQFANHEKTVRMEREDGTRRKESVLFGTSAKLNSVAYQSAMALVS
jgi:phage/plasmid-like protein (TIGR03299 family)